MSLPNILKTDSHHHYREKALHAARLDVIILLGYCELVLNWHLRLKW